jgi:hypothetical protein
MLPLDKLIANMHYFVVTCSKTASWNKPTIDIAKMYNHFDTITLQR